MSTKQRLKSLVSNPDVSLEEMFDIILEEGLSNDIHTNDSIRQYAARMIEEGNFCEKLVSSIEEDAKADYFCHDNTAGSNVPATAIYTKQDMMECVLYGYTVEELPNDKAKKYSKLISKYRDFIDGSVKLGSYIEALIMLPPCGEGAKNEVESEVKELCGEIRKGLQSIESMLKNKIWEE